MDDNTTSASIIVQPPLSFVRSGYVLLRDGRVSLVGSGGDDWSRTSSSSTNAYDLYFNSSGILPSSDDSRYIGIPLRCLNPPSPQNEVRRGSEKSKKKQLSEI